VVVVLSAVAFRDPLHVQHEAEVAAIGLTLPAFLPLVIFVYAILAASRNIFNVDSGGPGWPVALVYTVVFGGLAALEVFIVRRFSAERRARRALPRQG
jgi:hypothetical protein